MELAQIRNFCIIAHIDHGKSTLADRMMQLTRTVEDRDMREQLLDDVAGRNYDVFDRSIDVHMSSLRRKLDDNPRDPHYIKTIRSVGYMMMKH